MKLSKERLLTFVRIAFGFVWLVDAVLKWTPTFLNGLPSMLSGMITGQPTLIADWIHFWLGVVNINPFGFAILIAIIESVIAISLIFGIFTKEICYLGIGFSFLIWSVGEAFGGPYTAGSTDVGASIIYVFVFILLLIGIPRDTHMRSGEHVEKKRVIVPQNIAILAIVILFAILIAPYLVAPSQQTNSMQMADMPPGMMLKQFDIPIGSPIPTIDLVVTKDTFDGYDIHILTTNFVFTPENINQPPVLDQGHVHLYVDGVLSVVFGPWYHIGDLTPGKHTISASLNANDHSVFTVNGRHIDVTKTIEEY